MLDVSYQPALPLCGPPSSFPMSNHLPSSIPIPSHQIHSVARAYANCSRAVHTSTPASPVDTVAQAQLDDLLVTTEHRALEELERMEKEARRTAKDQLPYAQTETRVKSNSASMRRTRLWRKKFYDALVEAVDQKFRECKQKIAQLANEEQLLKQVEETIDSNNNLTRQQQLVAHLQHAPHQSHHIPPQQQFQLPLSATHHVHPQTNYPSLAPSLSNQHTQPASVYPTHPPALPSQHTHFTPSPYAQLAQQLNAVSSTYAPDLSDSRDLRALLDRVSAITAEALDPHSHTVPSGAELLQETWSQNPLDQHLTHPLNEQVIETVQPEPVPGPPPDQSQWDVPFTPSTSLDMVAWGTNNPGMHP